MACPGTDQLEAWFSGRLDPQRALLIETHLAECTACGLVKLSRTLPAPSTAGVVKSEPAEPEPHFETRVDAKGAEVELGRGGIGKVLLVGDQQLGRDVAMKVLLPGRAFPPSEQNGAELRFLREARVTGQLEHPAIVPVYQMGRRADGSLFYVMRRVTGRTLADALEAAGPLQNRLTLLRDVLAVCQAVAYAHSRHVVHRDLKPQNVMLGRFGETYLVDWGLAAVRGGEGEDEAALVPLESEGMRLTPNLTHGAEHVVMGTPAYMSPEQAEGKVALVDERSDVWGLGAILFEVLTGEPPRESLQAVVVPRVRSLEPTAPRELVAICERALSVEREKRYPSAAAMAADLEAWLNGRRVEAYTYRAVDLLRRFGWQYRAPLMVAALALLAIVTLSIFNWQRVRRERDEARELAQLVFGDLGRHLAPAPGVTPVVEAVTQRGFTFYERLLDEGDVPPAERASMATAVVRLLQLNNALGRFEESARLGVLCDRLVSPIEAGLGPEFLTPAINCAVGRASAAMQQGALDEAERQLREAERRAAFGSLEWKDPLWLMARSGLLSRWFQFTYARGEFDAAAVYAEKEVEIDSQLLEREPTPQRRQTLSASLRDLALVELARGSVKRGLEAGDRAISVMQDDSAPTADGLASLASAQMQQAAALRLVREELARASPLEEAARQSFERALKLHPGLVESREDFALLLLRMGRVQESLEQFQRVEAAGARPGPDMAMAALLAGQPEFVLSRRAALETDGAQRSLWVLALALVVTDSRADAALIARRAGADGDPFVEWPSRAVHEYAARVGGVKGKAIERFATDYDATLAADLDEWAPLFERFATELER